MTEQIARASETGHWYARDGKPVYEVLGSDGKSLVTPDIRHARKLGLVPGFTAVNKCLYSFGLERYKIRQAILAALTLPRREGESDEDYMARLDEGRSQGWRLTPSEVAQALRSAAASGSYIAEPIRIRA